MTHSTELDDSSAALILRDDASSALILRDDDPAAAAALERLRALAGSESVQFLDRLAAQRADLAKLLPPPEADALDEPAAWAYYPWRRVAVRILGPIGFAAVRFDRNRNKITKAEQERLRSKSVAVIGLSVGHAIAHTIALEGLCGELRLADFDTLELSNLNRIPATVLDLGLNKAVLAARRIAELDPYLLVRLWPHGITADSMDEVIGGLDVVIEECDSLDMKLLVREAARRHGVPVIMETSDRGLLDIERYDLDPELQPFHGLIGNVTAADLTGLSTHDKIPHVLRILEPQHLSARMAASMTEVDYTLKTWPQLGGDVALGGASVAALWRRLVRGDDVPSGRTRVDLDADLDALQIPQVAAELEFDAAAAAPLLSPPDDPTTDPIGAITAAAALAPSGGNIQPWTLLLDQPSDGRPTMTIRTVPARTSRMDVKFRASYVSIGAAGHNARIAAAAAGWPADTHVVADPTSEASDAVSVQLVFAGADGADSPHNTGEAALAADYAAMVARHSNRQLGDGRPLSDEDVELLAGAAALAGGTVHAVRDAEALTELAALIAESDRLRYLTPVLHKEMMSELRWPGRDDLRLGLDVRTLELDSSDVSKLAVAQRSDIMGLLAKWGVGTALGDVARERVPLSGALIALTIEGTTPADYVRGGEALERLWIAAQQAGLAIQLWSPVFLYALDDGDLQSLSEAFPRELGELSATIRQAMGIAAGATMIMILRASYAEPASVRSGRLPVSAVVEESESFGTLVPSGSRGRFLH